MHLRNPIILNQFRQNFSLWICLNSQKNCTWHSYWNMKWANASKRESTYLYVFAHQNNHKKVEEESEESDCEQNGSRKCVAPGGHLRRRLHDIQHSLSILISHQAYISHWQRVHHYYEQHWVSSSSALYLYIYSDFSLSNWLNLFQCLSWYVIHPNVANFLKIFSNKFSITKHFKFLSFHDFYVSDIS